MLQEIETLFAEDAVGLAVLEAAARGDSAAEVQAQLGLDATTYASTLRRIRRRLSSYLLPTET